MTDIEKFCKMINIPTIAGKDIKKFDEFHTTLQECFPLFHKHLKKIKLDGKALLFHWEGKNNDNPLVLMAHQDVVDANPEEWSSNPFVAEVREDKIYGRGTIDCKNVIFAIMTAVEKKLEKNFVPNQDIYISLSDNEEIGGDGCAKSVSWFKENKITPYVSLDEGGAIELSDISNREYAMIGVLEKGYIDVTFTANAEGGHSSQPGDDTPIERLAGLVKEISELDKKGKLFKEDLSQVTSEMYSTIAKDLPKTEDKKFKNKKQLIKILKDMNPKNKAMTQSTIVFTMMSGSSAPNIIPSKASCTANIRISPWDDKDDIIQKLKIIADKHNIILTEQNARNCSKLAKTDSDAYQLLSETIKETYHNEVGVLPFMLFGGTDSRTMEECVQYAFRCTPLRLSNEELSRMHGNDECVPVKSLMDSVTFFENYIAKYR